MLIVVIVKHFRSSLVFPVVLIAKKYNSRELCVETVALTKLWKWCPSTPNYWRYVCIFGACKIFLKIRFKLYRWHADIPEGGKNKNDRLLFTKGFFISTLYLLGLLTHLFIFQELIWIFKKDSKITPYHI